MDSDSWNTRFSTSSRRHQTRSDLYRYEETDGDDELKAEFLCPFCAEDFDVVGLCCHIDEEHPVETKNGVCPVCAKRVGSDLVSHVTTQHGSLLKVQRKRKFRKNGSSLTFSSLRRELREGYLHALLGGSSLNYTGNSEPDPLISSFMCNAPPVDQPLSVESRPPVEACPAKDLSKEELGERNVQQPLLSRKEQEETARKCEFVQGLLLSTILDDL